MNDEEETDPVIIDSFIDEARDHINAAESILVQIKANFPYNLPDQDTYNEIFRGIHTIKGGAGVFGLVVLEKLAHKIEFCLSDLKQGKTQLTKTMVSILLEGMDKLNELIEKKDTCQFEDIKDIENSIQQIFNKDIPKEEGSSGNTEFGLFIKPAKKQAEKGTDFGLFLPSPEKKPSPKPPKTPAQPKETRFKNSKNASIRIKVDIMDKLMRLAGELVLVRNQQLKELQATDQKSKNMLQRLDHVTTELQECIMGVRLQPLNNVFSRLPRTVRELGRALNKEIEIVIEGGEVEVDKTVIDVLSDPLIHMIRNSCDHGLEFPDEREKKGKPREGLLQIKAEQEGGRINISIRDDGKGVDINRVRKKLLEKEIKSEDELERMKPKDIAYGIFQPGFSTSENISEISGRGVGMDVVKTTIDNIGGSIELNTIPGMGTEFVLHLPLTLAILPCLIVESLGSRFAIPQINIKELVTLYDNDIFELISYTGNREVYRLRDTLLPLIRLNEILEHSAPLDIKQQIEICEKYRKTQDETSLESTMLYIENSLNIIVVDCGGKFFSLSVDRILGSEEIVVKPMHKLLKELGIYSGSTVMGDGNIALILNPVGILNHARMSSSTISEEDVAVESVEKKHAVILFRSGPHEILMLQQSEIRRIAKFYHRDIQTIGSSFFVYIDEKIIPLLRLDRFLSISESEQEPEEFYIIIPKIADIGLLASEIIDVTEIPLEEIGKDAESPFLKSICKINEKVCLHIDINELAEIGQRIINGKDLSRAQELLNTGSKLNIA